MDLVMLIYKLTASFPDCEKFGLVNQLRRAVVSVASNIAEGQGRLTSGEFRQFLGHSRGSLHEVCTQLMIAQKLEYMNEQQHAQAEALAQCVGRLLNGLIRSIAAGKCKEEEQEYGCNQ
jgi:four helix bundle protein